MLSISKEEFWLKRINLQKGGYLKPIDCTAEGARKASELTIDNMPIKLYSRCRYVEAIFDIQIWRLANFIFDKLIPIDSLSTTINNTRTKELSDGN
jgi:hypothetical protein